MWRCKRNGIRRTKEEEEIDGEQRMIIDNPAEIISQVWRAGTAQSRGKKSHSWGEG